MHPKTNFFKQMCGHKFTKIKMKHQHCFPFAFLTEYALLYKVNGRYKKFNILKTENVTFTKIFSPISEISK